MNGAASSKLHLLVVGASSPDPYRDVPLAKLLLVLLQGSDDACKRGGHVREVGNSSTNYEHLEWMSATCDQVVTRKLLDRGKRVHGR